MLIKPFVLPRSRCRCRRGLLKVCTVGEGVPPIMDYTVMLPLKAPAFAGYRY